jgi:hypothetical protein
MKKNLTAVLLLLAFTSIIVFSIFKPVIQHPNSYLFSHGGDAVKSYYNFSYNLKYGEGIKHKGINYPYGEHLQYINSHPFHTAVLKPISKILPISNYGVAILNLSMILSLIAAVPFLFLILRKYKLPIWYSFIVALIILFLSPQLDRIKGHFEMVYLFFIPMFWYLLIQFREGKRPWLWGILLVLSGLIGGFTSAYFVAFYAILLISVVMADGWKNRKNLKNYLKPGLTLLFMAVLPLLVVKGLVSITDWATDRPYNPWGFYVFHANPFSVFLPPNEALREILSKWFSIRYRWEGRSYVGAPATMLALSLVLSFVYRIVKRKKSISFVTNPQLNTFMFGATLILLFSMCFPFKWGFGFLLELLPPVKQFRALGRFAWIFYYVFTVYAAYYFYQLFLKLKEKGMEKFSMMFLLLILGFWSVDAAVNAKKSFNGIFLQNETLKTSSISYQHMFQEAQIEPDEFQAIFFLPFANTSGDKLLFEQGLKKAFGEAMKCSYHTKLPLIQSFSPRLPFSNALSTIQLLADSTIRKTRLDDMNEKPILMVITDERLTKKEKWLKNHSEELLNRDGVTFAKLSLDVYHNSYNNWLAYTDSLKSTLLGTEYLKADVELAKIYSKNFEEDEAENVFTGNGALFKRRHSVEIFNEDFSALGYSGTYELSFWLFFDDRMYDMPQAKIHIYKSNGDFFKTIRLNNRHIHNVYNSWVRVEQKITIEEGLRYKLELNGKYITIDELLFRPVNSNVLTSDASGNQLFNNFPL